MKRRPKGRLATVALRLAALVLAAVSGGAACMALQKAILPYNEEGRHFDGLTVHHAEAVGVYAAIAVIAAALALAALLAARRRIRRAAASDRSSRLNTR